MQSHEDDQRQSLLYIWISGPKLLVLVNIDLSGYTSGSGIGPPLRNWTPTRPTTLQRSEALKYSLENLPILIEPKELCFSTWRERFLLDFQTNQQQFVSLFFWKALLGLHVNSGVRFRVQSLECVLIKPFILVFLSCFFDFEGISKPKQVHAFLSLHNLVQRHIHDIFGRI